MERNSRFAVRRPPSTRTLRVRPTPPNGRSAPVGGETGTASPIAAGLIRTDRAKGGWATFTECIHGAPSEGRDAMWGTFGMTVVFVVGAIVAHRRLEP